ncbi:MAG: glycosyltransferase family 2 protein [Gelidibacter sp.]
MPQLSIIIPSYNNLALLRDCIDSIKNQSFTDLEVFIIDAKSSDGTIEFLHSLNEPFHWISGPDQGIYDAMNIGIALSKGKWLYFLGCDDKLFDPKTLETVFSQDINGEISLILGNIQYVYNDDDSYFIKRNKGVFKPSWSNKIWFKNTLHHQGVFYRREVFQTHPYSLAYKVLSDYDLNLKLFRSNLKVRTIDQIIAISKTEGISKNYSWQLYKEEIDLKSKQCSIVFRPLLYVLGVGKYLLKKAL